MEGFFYAGGLPALMKELGDRLDGAALTVVNGKTLGDNIAPAVNYNDDVLRPLANPVYHEGSLAVLRGNLAPDGAVIKPAACDPKFHRHTGPLIVADSYPELKRIIDDEDYPITANHLLCLRNASPKDGPGMPEWGMIPMPNALLKQGHRDILRISDARMSGTSNGACILHVAPDSFVGGPLALVQTGDVVEIDISARALNVRLSEAELAARRTAWVPPEPCYERGYGWIFARRVGQADKGCDFDFLETGFSRVCPSPTSSETPGGPQNIMQSAPGGSGGVPSGRVGV